MNSWDGRASLTMLMMGRSQEWLVVKQGSALQHLGRTSIMVTLQSLEGSERKGIFRSKPKESLDFYKGG